MRLWLLIALLPLSIMAEVVVKEATGVLYIKVGDEYRKERCRLSLRYPEGVKGYATVIWLHGGGLTGGEAHYLNLGDKTIAQVAVNYRLHTEENALKGEDIIRDGAEACAWVLEHIAEYGGDAKQVYLSGFSAGGYMTMMIGMDPRWMAEFGHSNLEFKGLVPISGQATKHFNVRRFAGDKDPQFLPKIDELAPLAYVGEKFSPILSVCGQPGYEWQCRAEENRLMIASINALGNSKAWMVELPYMNHGGALENGYPYIEQFIKRKTEWLK